MEAINTMSFTCAFPAHDKSLSAHENVYIRTQKCKPQKKKSSGMSCLTKKLINNTFSFQKEEDLKMTNTDMQVGMKK